MKSFWARWWIFFAVVLFIQFVTFLPPLQKDPRDGYGAVGVVLTVALGVASVLWFMDIQRSYASAQQAGRSRFAIIWARTVAAASALAWVLASAAAIYGATLEVLSGRVVSSIDVNLATPFGSRPPSEQLWVLLSSGASVVLALTFVWIFAGGVVAGVLWLASLGGSQRPGASAAVGSAAPGWYPTQDGTGRFAWWNGESWDFTVIPPDGRA